MSCCFFRSTGIFLYFCVVLPVYAGGEGATFEGLMQSRIEALRIDGDRSSIAAGIAAPRTVAEIYERNDFRPLWIDKDSVRQLMGQITAARHEGLDPGDYHHRALRRMEVIPPVSGARRIERELLLTDAMVRLGYHFRFGKADPVLLDPNWNYSRRLNGIDPAEQILEAVRSGRVESVLRAQLPDNPFYAGLRDALQRYRSIMERNGWPVVPEGPALRPGERDIRTPLLRRRLFVSGDLEDETTVAPELIDDNLESAIRHFQARHGLEVDGIAGRETLQVMNVPASERVDQIRVNMDRVRWVFHDVPESYLLVDIAGFRARLVEDGRVVWESRAQVGRPFRMTPVFRAEMSYVVLNPTWTVPPRIFEEDILPEVRGDVGYLDRNDLRVIDGRGREVDPRKLDWSRVTPDNFRFLLRQAPGPKNALGRIKFMFPNRHMVYLHDTPSRDLFGRSRRAFSSGCIRIEKPRDLAEILLGPDPEWDREGIVREIETGETRTVVLPESVPVLLVYYTADVRDDGAIQFRRDLYDRDAHVLRVLDSDGTFALPVDAPDWYRSAARSDAAAER